MQLHLGRFIFFTQFSARIQFSKYGLPILSFIVMKSFPLVFTSEHLTLPFLCLNIYQMS